MGFRLSGHVLETVTGLTPGQKLVLLGIAERADQVGENAFPSVATLATYAECSPRNVEIALKQLRAQGWVIVQKKATNRMPTTYRLNLERLRVRPEKTAPLADENRWGEESAPQPKKHADSLSKNSGNFGRGEESAPQAKTTSRGEVFGSPGAKFSTSRGEESSPDPIQRTDPGTDPEDTRTADAVSASGRSDRDTELALRAWFSAIVDVYPRGAKLSAAWTAFIRLKPDTALVDTILADIERKKRTVWGAVEPRYIPHLRTYLRDTRWLDGEDMSPVSQAEITLAGRIQNSRFLGRCPHQPPCPARNDCLITIALAERAQRERRPA